MPELRTAHTADLDASTRSAIRALMDSAFGAVSDDTFENVSSAIVMTETADSSGSMFASIARPDSRAMKTVVSSSPRAGDVAQL